MKFPLSRRTALATLFSVGSSAAWAQAAPAPMAALAAPATATPPEVQTVKGYAVVIGGALNGDNDEVWGRMVELAGGRGARFVVFATASDNPEQSGRRVVDLLQRRGAVAEHVPVAPQLKWVDLNKAVRDESLLDTVRAAQGIFFAGGSQDRIVDTLNPGGEPTPMLDAIWEVYRRGGVVAGTSAGAAIMSTVMFRDALSVIGVMKGQLRDGKEVDRGLGFVGPGLFIDQHFLKRGRFGRMIPLMLAKGYKLGLGVDENSAAIVHGDEVEIIGGKGAMLVDLGEVKTDPKVPVLNLTGARLSYLDRGDRLQLSTRAVTPSNRKLKGEKLDPNGAGYKPEFNTQPFYVDMLGDSVISNAMAFLIDSSQQEVRGLSFDPKAPPADPLADLGFSFRLYKGAGSLGWYSDVQGADEYTVANLYLDISPVRMSRPLFAPWTR
ncbi:MAG TPA: cyanophycinase [Ideonella sp.]|nr:cyanophycinase [Ideonella sp.]